jgi:type I restriction enzyme S subunit
MREDLIKIRVGDIADLKNGFAFKSKDYVQFSNTMNFRMSQIRPGGKVNLDHSPIYLPDNYAEVYSHYLLQEGDVVIAMTDMASDTKILGVPTLVKKDIRNLLLNQRVGKFTDLRIDIIHIPYLRYIITSPQIYGYYKKLGKGGMQINLGKNDILNAEFTLVSLPEQRAVVDKIEELFSSLDSGIADLKKAQEQLKIYRQAVLQKAFEGEYKEVKVIDLSEVKTGSTPKRGNNKYWEKGSIPWVTSGALNDIFVTEAKEYITEVALKETNCKIIEKGSLLIAMYGEGKTRGKCSELSIDAATNQAVATITLFEEYKESKLFLKWFFLKNYEEIRLFSNGGVQPNLNLSIVKNTIVPFPSIEEQHQIVQEIENRLSVCDKVEETIVESLEKSKALRQSILKKAFEGRLLSAQELAACKSAPDYEPASVLLERIKAEKNNKK